MIHITRRETFSAAHRLFREAYSDRRNEEVFGKCAHANWHGHNYTLFVTVGGEMSPETSFVMDMKILSALIIRYVIEPLDHKNINLDVEFMKGKLASTENLAMAIWDVLNEPVKQYGASLVKIALHETENNYVEYYGNESV